MFTYLLLLITNQEQHWSVFIVLHISVQCSQADPMFECAVDKVPVMAHRPRGQIKCQLLVRRGGGGGGGKRGGREGRRIGGGKQKKEGGRWEEGREEGGKGKQGRQREVEVGGGRGRRVRGRREEEREEKYHQCLHTAASCQLITTTYVSDVLVERHVAMVYVMIVNCWTSHGRRTLMTTFRSVCAALPQAIDLRKISTD